MKSEQTKEHHGQDSARMSSKLKSWQPYFLPLLIAAAFVLAVAQYIQIDNVGDAGTSETAQTRGGLTIPSRTQQSAVVQTQPGNSQPSPAGPQMVGGC